MGKKNEVTRRTSRLLNISPLNPVRDILETLEDFRCGFMLSDFEDDFGDGGVENAEKRENDHVGYDHEEEVSSCDGTIQAGACWCACGSDDSVSSNHYGSDGQDREGMHVEADLGTC